MLYIKDGIIRDGSRIIIVADGYQTINPTEEMILADGWEKYTPETPDPVEPEPTVDDQIKELILEQYNEKTDISDDEAMKRPLLVYAWSTYINKSLKTGQIISYDEKLWRVRQDISVVLENQEPSLATAALYEVIEIQPTGTIDDPIPYTPSMEIFNGKYYTQNDVKYLCIRDSQTALNHNLADLVGNYVSVVE